MIEYKGVNYYRVTKIVYKYPEKIKGVYALYGSFMHAVLENMVRKHFNMEERDFFVNHLDGLSCFEASEQIQRDVQNFSRINKSIFSQKTLSRLEKMYDSLNYPEEHLLGAFNSVVADAKELLNTEIRFYGSTEFLNFTGQIDFLMVGFEQNILIKDFKTSNLNCFDREKKEKCFMGQLGAYQELLRLNDFSDHLTICSSIVTPTEKLQYDYEKCKDVWGDFEIDFLLN